MTTVLEVTNVAGVRRLYRLSLMAAVVSGTCSVFLTAVLIHNYLYEPSGIPTALSEQPYQRQASDSFNLLPSNDKTFIELRQQLSSDKTNETLKDDIRQRDEKLRQIFFQRRILVQNIAPLLLITAAVFFVSVRICSVLNRRLPTVPQAAPLTESNTVLPVIIFASVFIGIAAGILLTPSTPLEALFAPSVVDDTSAPQAVLVTETPSVTVETVAPALTWTCFRGADGNGVGISDKPPVKWNAVTGENVVWKTDIALPGKSSPVIYGTKLFLTGADEKTQHIYCYDISNGQLIWTADVSAAVSGEIKVSEDTGYAAPTPATDGQFVFAMFANGELVATDFAGKIVWRQSFGVPESVYGYSASPVLYNGKVIIQYDVGDGSEPKSKIVALDGKSGKTVWETPREVPNSWSSPTLQKIGETYQVITCADPFVIAYNPDDGKEIWRCKCLSADVGPSAVAAENVVFVANQSPRATAIDATGSGDVTKTHILWQGTNALPDAVSPFIANGLFFTLDSGGYMTCYDPKTAANKRAKFWELEIGGGESSFYASPLRVGQLVYVFSKTEGSAKAFVIDLSKAATDDSGALTEESAKAMLLAENPMPQPCVASPAIIANRLYIRSATTAFCIEER